jgi:hypothetical protein
MTFKPSIWHPVAIVLSSVNLLGAGYAVALSEPAHAAGHVALALGFGFWARRLRGAPGESEDEARLELLETEVNNLRGELSEAQERLDFTERLLAQGSESRRSGLER